MFAFEFEQILKQSLCLMFFYNLLEFFIQADLITLIIATFSFFIVISFAL